MRFRLIDLDDLGVLAFSGADVVRFLQGQLSADVSKLSGAPSLLAGYHNREGRVVAILRLVEPAPGRIIAILPREMVAPVAARLRKFVLRAKVTIEDESETWRVRGVAGETAREAPPAADSALLLPLSKFSARWLRVSPREPAKPEPAVIDLEPAEWRALDVADGLPQIYAATSEAFVSQMLNLDALGAIAFDKGCYTGQEVIARAHYRGRVKRRLQRFRTVEEASLEIGASAALADGRSFRVVEAARLPDGRTEFLAVAPLGASGDEPGPSSAAAVALERIAVEPLLLPYELPH